VAADGARAVGLALLWVEEDQVDVGGHVQLAAAELAHGHNQKGLGLAGQRPQRPAMRLRQPWVEMAQGEAHAFLGERGHGLHDLGQVRRPAQVAGDHMHHHRLAHLA
jgi:hypothetical protein